MTTSCDAVLPVHLALSVVSREPWSSVRDPPAALYTASKESWPSGARLRPGAHHHRYRNHRCEGGRQGVQETRLLALRGSKLPDPRVLEHTHVHTGWSADAGAFGATLGPEEAFRFARGKEKAALASA
jgi:Protein of unknown function (DUF3604)